MTSYEETEEVLEVYPLGKTAIMVEKKIHDVWKMHKQLQRDVKDRYRDALGKEWKSHVGQHHYIYTSDKGRISLVELPDYSLDGKTLWEIYSLKGDLFEDVERFATQKEAEVRIKELLEEPKRVRGICPKCKGHKNIVRRGKRYNETESVSIQRYKCLSCDYKFIEQYVKEKTA